MIPFDVVFPRLRRTLSALSLWSHHLAWGHVKLDARFWRQS